MKVGSAVLLSVLAAASTCCCDAFRIHSHPTPVATLSNSGKTSLIVPSSNHELRMVAGGAERAYGDDYYEGMYRFPVFMWN
jgi:hypothetical protein